MILKPDYNAKTIFEVKYNELKDFGVKVLVFDLDSTVMKSKSAVFTAEVLQLFTNLKKDFFIVIASNNSDNNYIAGAGAQVDFPVLGNVKKPNPAVIVKFLKNNGIETKNAAIIGDRPLTDILAGKLAGMKTVLVDSINWFEEPVFIRFARRAERIVVIR
jgi:HAD superfamily phosphatase (TIGR01668 family)